ncbi:MAG TPA: phosphatase PAP2 family protein [Longimicrobiales bacterium]
MTALLLRISARDEKLLHALVQRRHKRLDRIMRSITRLGDPASAIAATGVMLLLGQRAAGARAAFALAASHLAVQAVKRTVNRPRPRMPVGVESLIHAPDRFSFPSGHSAATMSVALPLAAILPLPAAAGVLGLALLVGLSRSYLGVHYPGDVLAGWVLAVGGLAAAGPILQLLALS